MLTQSRLDQQPSQHANPNVARDLFRLDLFTPQLHLTQKIRHYSIIFDDTIARCTCLRGLSQSLSLDVKWPVLSLYEISTIAAIRKGNMKNKDGRDRHKHPPRPGPRFTKNWRFYDSRQQSSSSDQNTRVSQSAKNATPPPTKN